MKKEELQKKCQEYLNGWQRAKADYENLKKQNEKEKEEFVKFANLNLIMGLIPVYNNLKLALEQVPDNDWTQGVKQVKKQMSETFSFNGVEEINVKVGDKFDPAIHEAVKSNPNDLNKHLNDPKIEKVVADGYKINSKIFMPAKVIVK